MNYNYNPIADAFDQNQILGYATLSNFPLIGKSKFLYLDRQKNYLYTWSISNQRYELVSTTIQNSVAVQEKLGGIKPGTTFNNIAITDIINRLLYPVQFSSFTVAPDSNTVTFTEPLDSNNKERTLEVGQSIFNTNTTSTIKIILSTNFSPVTNLLFKEDYYGLLSLPNNPSDIAPSIPDSRSISASNVFTTNVLNHFSVVPGKLEWWLNAKDNLNQSFDSFKYTLKWVYRSIAFCSTNAGLINIPVAGLRTDIPLQNNGLTKPTSITTPSTLTTPNYIYIFIPKLGNSPFNLDLITSSGITVPFVFTELTSPVSRVVSSRETKVLYYMYRSLNPLAGSIKINLE